MLYKLRNLTSKYFEVPIAKILIKLRFSPNLITLIGLALAIVSGFLISDTTIQNHFVYAAIILLMSGILDLFDGAVARLTNNVTQLGAFIDSFSDRIGEIAVFLGITIYFGLNDNLVGSSLTLAALGGSLTVSYIRARAEALKIKCETGLVARPERIILLFIGILAANWWPPMLTIVMGILTVTTIITSFQRFLIVVKHISKST
jgi:CDP-diacylglycerol--glycerol-3-phosphate 3-phosphatidyltransferase